MIQIKRGHYTIVETHIQMNMAIHLYEYGRGGKCVYMFRYTEGGIGERKMQMDKKDRYKGRVMRTSIGTVTEVSIKFVEKEERKKKDGYKYRTEHKTYI